MSGLRLVLIAACISAMCWVAEAKVSSNVLFVSSGHSQQEVDIYNYLLERGYKVTSKPGYSVCDDSDLKAFDLVVVTGFDLSLLRCGVNRIKKAGLPVLIIEHRNFWHSWSFGVARWPFGSRFATEKVALVNASHPITSDLDPTFQVYESDPLDVPECRYWWCPGRLLAWYQRPPTTVGIAPRLLGDGVTPLISAAPNTNKVSVFADDNRRIVVTGISDTRHYTEMAWKLLDLFLEFLTPPAATKTWEFLPSPRVPDSVITKSAGRDRGETLIASYGKAYLVSGAGTPQPVHNGT
ncbi:MAG: hypothetical protein GY854_34240, partial [Deltaproteobacteria bacterium]|nr:hypothetical protein [Deltaproteobacteria bacterium]